MLAEVGILGFLSFWVMSEYMYNAYFRSYAGQLVLDHATTLTAIVGLAIGITGTAVAVNFYKSLRDTKLKLEDVVAPRIRGIVDKVLPTPSGIELGPVVASKTSESEVVTEASNSQIEAFDSGSSSIPLKNES